MNHPGQTERRRRLGREIRDEREARGLTLQGVKDMLHQHGLERGHSLSHLSSVERGDSWPSQDLICALEVLFECPNRFQPILRDAKVPNAERSVEIEADLATFLAAKVDAVPEVAEPTRFGTAQGTMFLFPYKVIVLPAAAEIRASDLTEIALIRQQILRQRRNTLTDSLAEAIPGAVLADDDPCGLCCVTLRKLTWDDPLEVDAAVRLMSCPSLLISSHQAEFRDQHERDLLRRSRDILDVECFSVPGSHVGYATWSGVAIFPEAESLIGSHLQDIQLELQSLWCYASYCSRTGIAEPGYTSGYLTGRLRGIMAPGPTEHIAQRLLRDALIRTSRVDAVVSAAIAAVEDEMKVVKEM